MTTHAEQNVITAALHSTSAAVRIYCLRHFQSMQSLCCCTYQRWHFNRRGISRRRHLQPLAQKLQLAAELLNEAGIDAKSLTLNSNEPY